MLKLSCPKCQHEWEAAVEANQRLVFCPGCTSLVPPVEAATKSKPPRPRVSASNSSGLLPFSFNTKPTHAQGDDDAVAVTGFLETATGSARRDSRLCILLLELANAAALQQRLAPEHFKRVVEVVKKVFRYGLAQYGGTEVDKSKGLLILFDRPVDAARFAVNLMHRMEQAAAELGEPVKARIGMDFDHLEVRRHTDVEVAAGNRPVEVKGDAIGRVRALAVAAHPGQVLMTAPAHQAAFRDSANSFPPGTRWITHGMMTVPGIAQPLELFEVGEQGVAPLARPGAALPAAAARRDEGMTLMGALQFGAAQMSQSLAGGGAAAKPAGPRQAEALAGSTIGGYRVDSLRGEDRQALYYVARDESLDRDVVLKVLRPEAAARHEDQLRFIREGICASYITHPNLYNAYEAGCEGDIHFIAYEFIEGTNLGELVRSVGTIQPRVAAGYILQVARALKGAHDAGVIHRDIRPANLVLTTDNRMEVTGLSLAKVAEEARDTIRAVKDDNSPIMAEAIGQMTAANVSLGVPAYIAPEQARDAASVTFAADQYSLGCVFHFVLTGKPPVEGRTTLEVLSNLARRPPRPLHESHPEVPEEISAMVARLLAQKPADRYRDMGHVIEHLEVFLGIRQAEATPAAAQRERRPEGFPPELFDRLVADQQAYYGVALARTRGWLHGALLFVCAVAAIVLVWADWFQFGAAAVGLYILTVVANIVVGGVINRNPLLLRLWRALWVLPWTAWGVGAVVGAGALYLLYATGLLPFYGAIALVAVGIAFVYQAGLVLPLRLARARHVAATLDVVKGLRTAGYSEQYIGEAVYAAGAAHWEEFFEAAFGYERMIAQRHAAEREKRNGDRRYHARWRDPIHQWLGDVEESRRAARSGQMLATSARKRLEATGMDEREARLKAREEALAAMEEERRRAEAMSMAGGFGPPMGMPGMALGGPRQYDYMAGRGGVLHAAMTSLRSAIGSGIMLGFIAPQLARMAGIGMPANVQGWLTTYWSWGWGGSVHALVISGIVMRNAASRRYVASVLGIAGALMLVAREPVVRMVDQPSFDAQTCVFFGCGLMMMSLGTGFLRRFTSPRGFLPF